MKLLFFFWLSWGCFFFLSAMTFFPRSLSVREGLSRLIIGLSLLLMMGLLIFLVLRVLWLFCYYFSYFFPFPPNFSFPLPLLPLLLRFSLFIFFIDLRGESFLLIFFLLHPFLFLHYLLFLFLYLFLSLLLFRQLVRRSDFFFFDFVVMIFIRQIS